MSIAVDRIQNYYQYSDAEAKFYQLQSPENKDVKENVEENSTPIISNNESNQEVKAKKSKKNKKKENSDVAKKSENTQDQQPKNVEKVKSVVVKESSKEEDSGIAESPTSPTEPTSAAAKKKSRSKRQREKKALAAQQSEQKVESPTKPEENTASNVANVEQAAKVVNQPQNDAPKAKDNNKKKNKNASADQKGPSKDETKNGVSGNTSTLATEIAKARQHIKSSLERVDGVSNFNIPGSELLERISVLEKDNTQLRGLVDGMQKLVISLEARLNKLEKTPGSVAPAKSTPAPAAAKKVVDDDDDVDLFGSDEEEDEEAERIKEERLKAYAEKKSKKPVLIAKSSILLDVKPWDDETDMKEMEKLVRTIVMDGLIWGVSKLIPLAYGIKKLQIICVIEDDKVSVDELCEKIQEFEDFVQSVDIAAFNKI